MYLNHKFTCAGNTSLFSFNSFYFKFPFHQVYQSEDSKKTETAVGVSAEGDLIQEIRCLTLWKELGKQTVEYDVSCELVIQHLLR